MKYLILIADPDEYNPFIGELNSLCPKADIFHTLPCSSFEYKGIECLVLCTNVGKVNTAAACAAALCEGEYGAVISLGYSGAVSGLHKNDLVAGSTYVECDFDLTVIGYKPGEKNRGVQYVRSADAGLLESAMKIPGIKSGSLGTGDFFLTDKALREKYIKDFNICAFDMETGAAANVCSLFGAPYLAIRKISDDADDAAADAYRDSLNSTDRAFSDILISLLDVLSM